MDSIILDYIFRITFLLITQRSLFFSNTIVSHPSTQYSTPIIFLFDLKSQHIHIFFMCHIFPDDSDTQISIDFLELVGLLVSLSIYRPPKTRAHVLERSVEVARMNSLNQMFFNHPCNSQLWVKP
jgi:hypothetical protein